MPPLALLLALLLALAFAFLNGFHDSASIVAVSIASRAMTPRQALLWTALGEFVGPFVLGSAVAVVVGTGLLTVDALTLTALMAALGGAVVWGGVTWWWGLPSSSSHALVGGLVGAAWAAAGVQAVQWRGLAWVLLALFVSPPFGFGAGFILTRWLFVLARSLAPATANRWFRRGQWLTTLGLALSHGANDGQKSVGLIALALLLAGRQARFHILPPMVWAVAATIALGAAIGGWRLIRTVGGRILRVRPVHGFMAQLSSAVVVAGAAWGGAPISTTQVINSALMGAGAAERWSKVRWRVARDMAIAWLLTIPASASLAAGFYTLLRALAR